MSTPMKPPGTKDGKAWNKIIAMTATARRPSISFLFFVDFSEAESGDDGRLEE